MSKLTRYTQQLFGSTAGSNQMAEFGSLAAGAPAEYSGTTITPALVQGLSNYLQGWYGAVQGQNSPTIQDMNALCYLFAYQLCYGFQAGVAEWDSGTTYYTGSIANSAGILYQSLQNANLNNAVTNTSFWAPISGLSTRNLLINGAFDYWQRGTTVTVANGVSTYQADRWYVNNAMGVVGVITFSQVVGTLLNSIFGASVKVTTAPTTPINTGVNLVHVLENLSTIQIYNGSASFQCNIKALGLVNQVTLSLVYATTEIKPTLSNVITSVTATVNSSGFVTCQLPNISVGTNSTLSGVVAVVISATGVSGGGHVSDLNNGFVVEQASLNPSVACAQFERAGRNPQAELAMCQRYFEKSFPITTTPVNASVSYGYNGTLVDFTSGSKYFGSGISYAVPKRIAAPTITPYNSNSASSGTWSHFTAANGRVDITPAFQTNSNWGFTYTLGYGGGAGAIFTQGNWTCDAEI